MTVLPKYFDTRIDRLLQSPHYGEHWARHWMDVVRFGETLGYEWNYEVLVRGVTATISSAPSTATSLTTS